MAPDPFSRQRRLAEVGDRGQERIEAHAGRVPAAPGARLELAYLFRAGVQTLELSPRVPLKQCPHGSVFRHSPARAAAEGAWRALCQLKEALGVAPR